MLSIFGLVGFKPRLFLSGENHTRRPPRRIPARAAVLLLLGILREMAQGHAVTLMHAELTRQAQELGLGY